MKKRFMILIIIVVFGGLFFYISVPQHIHDQSVSGMILTNQIWSGEIHVTGDVEVLPWSTLTILPGTVIKVAARSDDRHGGKDHPRDVNFPKDPDRTETQSTAIRGRLNALGTAGNRIIFTSDSENPTTYDWDGLFITQGKLEYVTVEYARYNSIQKSSDVVIANSIFRNSLECCICIGHSGPVSPQILNNDIYNCGHECIDYAGGSAVIRGNHFHAENPEIQPDPSIGRTGVSVYQNAYPVIENNTFEKLSSAVLLSGNPLNEPEEGKKAILRNNIIKNNRAGIDTAPGYPTEEVIMENNQLSDNERDMEYIG